MNPLIILAAPFLGAFISFFIGQRNETLRNYFDIILTAGIGIGVLTLYPGLKDAPIIVSVPQLMGTGLDISIGPLQYLLIALTSALWFIITVFLTQYIPSRHNRNRFHFFFLLTYGGTLGFFMTNNILNQFTFFEILSLSAYFLIIHEEDASAHEAGSLYLPMAILGGLAALLGILIAYEATGTLMLDNMSHILAGSGSEKYVVGGLLFFGYAIKAGIFPMHIWVPKAYASAPIPATAILTGVLAKTGLYGLFTTVIIITDRSPAFCWLALSLGFITLMHGGVLALFQVNVKRILAYSSMSQYGLILVGIGAGGLASPDEIGALTGSFIHMVSHGLFKVLLFLIIGLLYLRTQELDLNLIRGIGRRNGFFAAIIGIAVLSAWGIPGFTGFISKNLLHEGLNIWAHHLAPWAAMSLEVLFTLGSGLTSAYFIKLCSALFIDPTTDFSSMIWLKRRKRAALPMIFLAVLIVGTGIYSAPIKDMITAGLTGGGDHPFAAGETHGFNAVGTFLPIAIGLLIHRLFTTRILQTTGDDGIHYRDLAQNWFSFEKNLYVPSAAFLLRNATALTAVADSGLVKTVAALSRWLKAADALLTPQASPSHRESPVIMAAVQPTDLPATPDVPSTVDISTPPPGPIPEPVRLWTAPLRKIVESTSGLTFALYVFAAFLLGLIVLMTVH